MESTERHILVFVSELSHVLGAMELALGDHGYRVRFASDRDEALELSSQQVFDLVITDQETLRTEGTSLLERVQAHCPCASIMVLHGDADPGLLPGRMRRGLRGGGGMPGGPGGYGR